jgi:acyl-coenzyme A thioesterase PaaI-like protein
VDPQELADLSRVFLDRLVTAKAPAEALARAGALVAEATAILDAHVPTTPRNLYEELGEGADFLDVFRLNPVIGRLNPVAPTFELRTRDAADPDRSLNGREVVAAMTLPILYEGPMAMVHGGIISSLFDQLLAIANIDNGLGAYTGTLTITYRAPCPLEVPLRFICRTERVEGRKVFATGELRTADLLVAEAEGVFILPSDARLVELVQQAQRANPIEAP